MFPVLISSILPWCVDGCWCIRGILGWDVPRWDVDLPPFPCPTPEGKFHTFWDRDVRGCDLNLQNVYNPRLLLDERSTSSQKGYPWSKTINYLYPFCCCCRCAGGVVHGTGDEGRNYVLKLSWNWQDLWLITIAALCARGHTHTHSLSLSPLWFFIIIRVLLSANEVQLRAECLGSHVALVWVGFKEAEDCIIWWVIISFIFCFPQYELLPLVANSNCVSRIPLPAYLIKNSIIKLTTAQALPSSKQTKSAPTSAPYRSWMMMHGQETIFHSIHLP